MNEEVSKQPEDVHESFVMLIIDSSSTLTSFCLTFPSFCWKTFLSLNARAATEIVSDEDFPALESYTYRYKKRENVCK